MHLVTPSVGNGGDVEELCLEHLVVEKLLSDCLKQTKIGDVCQKGILVV